MASPRKFSEAQERSIALSTGRINIWEGATRGGKTFASLFRWFAYIADRASPKGELAMVGRTRETIGTNALLQMQNPALFGNAAMTVKYTLGAPAATILDRRVHLYGANDVQAETKIRGATFAGMYGDELTILPREFVLQAFNRLSVPGSKFFGTTNPGPSAHWLRKDFLLRADEPGMNLRQFHFNLDDNPSLTDEVKAGIKATNTGMYYRRFVLGEWCNAEGAVYQMFDADRHVVDICPVITRWLACGIDYAHPRTLRRHRDRPWHRQTAVRDRGMVLGFSAPSKELSRRGVLGEAPRVLRVGPVPWQSRCTGSLPR